ncbi:hypothetical protein KEJ27_02295 [Candidatus Bathyarchaeota archaeon]|nr:hypothetical protein [Candidatus Bathyarchaeota archaeon]MBS7613242.1 hypothetical protein [Candidatus Bathyarchaeota archaeon]MBS7618028.1 hypothetical protein [Candidatus Bathyarchaeota archaeon]
MMTRQIKKAATSIVLGVVLAIILSTTLQAPLQTHTDEEGKVRPLSQGISEDVEASNKSLSQTFGERSTAEFQQLNFTPIVTAFIVGLIVYILAKTLIR